jgi:diacylglycerol kinase family enzyme
MEKLHKAIVIHSPYSGRADQLSSALTRLRQNGVEIVETTSIATLDNLPAQGKDWQENGIDIALAAGGDGVIGGVISHIIESGLPLGILPLGTSNDIARSLRIPLDLSQAAELIARGHEAAIDIGMAQPAEQAPHQANPDPKGPVLTDVPRKKHSYFAHALTIGLNVQFARLATNVATRKRFGRMTYPLAAIEVLGQHRVLEASLSFHDASPSPQNQQPPTASTQVSQLTPTSLQCRALQVAVINAPVFGGRWQFAIPSATISDQLLDIVVIEDVDMRTLGTSITNLFNPQQNAAPQANQTRHHPADLSHLPGIHHLQVRGVTITTNADPQDVTLDGEVRGQTAASVRLAPQQLRVVVPQ